MTDVRRLWPEVLEEVKGRRRFTWILLSQNAHVADVRDGVLVLAMAGIGARDSFAKGGSENILREALNDALGVDLRIETIVDPSVSSGGRGGSGPMTGGGSKVPAASTTTSDGPTPAPDPPASVAADPSPSSRPAPAANDEGSDNSGRRSGPEAADPRWREQARQGIRPTRQGGGGPGGEVEDLRDEAVSVYDSNIEELEESQTELLARQLGAEIIGEEPHDA